MINQLEEIVRSVLKIPKDTDLDKSFVDLGGQSILATQIQMKIYKEFRLKVKVADFYQYETVNQMLAAVIEKKEKEKNLKIQQNLESQDDALIRDMMKRLEDIVRSVLKISENVNLDKSFVDLGGQSILATQIQMRIYKEFRLKVKVAEFYQYETVGKMLTEVIEKNVSKINAKAVQAKNDLESHEGAFPLKDMQLAYLVGRNKEVGLGGEATHAYCEMEVEVYEHERFCKAVRKLLATHEILRYQFFENGTQKQVDEDVTMEIPLNDIRNFSQKKKEQFLNYKREEVFQHKFDLKKPPLIYFEVTRTEGEKAVIHFCHDGLVVDGWSHENIVKDLDYYYSHPDAPVIQLEASYKKYCEYLEQQKSTEFYKACADFWLHWSKNMPDNPELPLLRNANEIRTAHTRQVLRTFRKSDYKKIAEIAKRWDVSSFAILITIYGKAIARCSTNQRFLLNIPMAMRPPIAKDIWDMVGECSNFMLFDFDNKKNESLKEAAIRNHRNILELLDYNQYSGIEFLSELQKKNRKTVSAPVVFTSTIDVPYRPSEQIVKTYTKTHTSQVWIDAVLMHRQDEVIFTMDCVEDLIPVSVAEEIADEFVSEIQLLVQDENSWETRTSLQISANAQKTIENCVATEKLVQNKTVGRLIYDSLKKYNKNTMLCMEHIQYTYGEVLQQANTLNIKMREAYNLQAQDVVGIYVGKGIEGVIAEVACVLNNLIFLPMEIEYTAEQIEVCCRNANIKCIYTDEMHYEMLTKKYHGNIMVISTKEKNILAELDQDIYVEAAATDVCYIINTSGTTGEPKSILVENEGFAECLLHTNEKFSITEKDSAIAITSFCHDMSLYDVFGMIVAGGSIVIPSEKKVKDPVHWKNLMEQYSVTVWNSVPAFMDMFLSYEFEKNQSMSRMRYIFLGGDWVRPELVKQAMTMFDNSKIVSVGGPSETTLWNICHIVTDEDLQKGIIPYGIPFPNTQYYILNQNMEICPPGIRGTMYVEGIGVARGYAGKEKETADKFIIWQEKRVYNTGDQGYYNEQGEIIFCGRNDFQVKIHGKRIELTGIEKTIEEIENIQSCVVVLDEKRNVLRAFYTAKNEIEQHVIIEYLEKKLLPYMIPKEIYMVDKMPLTKNGKIDRKALAERKEEITLESENITRGRKSDVLPILLEICKKMFHTDNITEDISFYDIGGNSIMAIRLITEIRKQFGTNLSIYDIMNEPYPKYWAEMIVERGTIDIEVGTEREELCEENFGLTKLQEDMWTYEMLHKDSRYIISAYMDIEEQLEQERMHRAIELVVAKHLVLQCCFEQGEDGLPVQKRTNKMIGIQYLQLTDEQYVEQYQNIISEERMDLKRGGLAKCTIIQLNDKKTRILLTMHHIIADEQTYRILFDQILDEYYGKRVDYTKKSFLAYIRMKKQEEEQQKEYDLTFLEEYHPLSINERIEEKCESNTYCMSLPKEIMELIDGLAKEKNVSVFDVLLWAYASCLNDIYEKRIYISIPVSDRGIGDFEKTAGLFLEKIIITFQGRSIDTWEAQLQQVKRELLKAYEQTHGAFSRQVKEKNLIKKRNAIHNGYIFNMIDTTMLENNYGRMHYVMSKQENSMSDFQMLVEKGKDEYLCRLSSGNGSYEICALERFSQRYLDKLKSLFENVECNEKQEKTLVELFIEACGKEPQAQAVCSSDGSYTYAEFYFTMLQRTGFLQEKGVQKGDMVALHCGQNKETIAWIYAILAAGAVYVPIDYAMPQERIKTILLDCQAKYYITEENCAFNGIQVIDFASDFSGVRVEQVVLRCTDMQQQAYVMYTSGSTGTPKGVPITQQGIVNMITWYGEEMKVSRESKLILLNNFGFDGSVKHLFTPLSVGAQLVLVKDELYDITYLVQRIEQEKVTHLATVPSLLREIVLAARENDFQALRTVKCVVSGGENLTRQIIEPWMQSKNCFAEFVNVYGPAESSCVSLFHRVTKEDIEKDKIPLGKAIPGKKVYLLNKNKEVCQYMEEGEIYIGGIGTFTNYVGKTLEESNLEEYPLGSQEKIFKTGDLAICNENGDFEYLGRTDYQIKINGQRFETEELERIFMKHAEIENCIYVVEQDGEKQYYTLYYVTRNASVTIDDMELRDFLKKYLPESVLPQRFIRLNQMPLSPNGKIDRKKLSACKPILHKVGRRCKMRNGEKQKLMLQVMNAWKETLDLEEVPENKGFFELGGSSLLYYRLQNAIKKHTGIDVSINTILTYQTMKEMVEYLEKNRGAI